MAIRPVFLPKEEPPFWKSVDLEFQWHPGMSFPQKQKSVESLHFAALNKTNICRALEVSSKSPSHLGKSLSAFLLRIPHHRFGEIHLESAFQGSKRFATSGLLQDAYQLEPRSAKSMASTVNEVDQLIGFEWAGKKWPLEPKSWFYDWLYISAVVHTLPDALDEIRSYDAFTDIEFNPKKSFSCQARACAIIASSSNDEELEHLINNPRSMIKEDIEDIAPSHEQTRLFEL